MAYLLPTYLTTYPPACVLPAYPPTYLLNHLPIYLPTYYPPNYLWTYPPTHVPPPPRDGKRKR